MVSQCQAASYAQTLIQMSYIVVIILLIQSGGRLPVPKRWTDACGLQYGIQVPFIGALSKIEPGQIKVVWSTIQIVTAIGAGLDMSFPEPYNSFTVNVNVVNLSFLSIDCAAVGPRFGGPRIGACFFQCASKSFQFVVLATERPP